MSGVLAMAATSALTDGASLATRMVRTPTRLASRGGGPRWGRRPGHGFGAGAVEQEVGDRRQAGESWTSPFNSGTR